ncbi:hypothetical protein SAMN04489729_1893 [Amycolatopsis lurida]|uniref:Uncharacterized protein n=1 Tax=Amycolatopsis lurida NRRL 2430 TaxID=1460371 RepID=A0A2P2FGY9_AMYLU|nr:hypothetical protein [Amycolatopsis lurida]KFU75984.1 hypothetical protein BB31_38380 [Amycolatopsis lurida NRRL 2430]SEC57094.1 hypothetical protein SAMN04489729_1893 [Amycolatopsis lurida]
MGILAMPELRIVQDLQHAGLTRSAATLAVVMATRRYDRPERDLAEIVRHYPGLESVTEARLAIQDLLHRKWLTQTVIHGVAVTGRVPSLANLIATHLGDESVADSLPAVRVTLEPYITILGPMENSSVFHSYLSLLRSARSEICMPMLVTPPYEETVRALRDRAEAGVRIRILLAAPTLAVKWRSETMRSISTERINAWVHEFRNNPTVEIRLSRTAEDMELATCFSVDGETVRFDIYDPYRQRSLEGVMIEVAAPQGMLPNFIRMFLRLFEESWSNSVQVSRLARFLWFLRKQWKSWLAIFFLLLAFVPTPVPRWPEILIGISCGITAPLLIEGIPQMRKIVRKRRSR